MYSLTMKMSGNQRALLCAMSVDSPTLSPERQQRRMLAGLLVLAAVVEAGVALYLTQDPEYIGQLPSVVIGLVVTLILAGLTLQLKVRVAHLHRTVVVLAVTWMLVNIHSLATTHRPVTSGMLLHMVLLALLAFSWLPHRWAVGTVIASYGLLCFGATFSRGPDIAGLLLLGFLLTLTWYLTLHGNQATTERSRSRHLAELAATDPLTGLCNRRSGEAQLEALASEWQNAPDCLSVLVLDLDHFKRINDSLGHAKGDELLVAVSGVLMALTRSDDVVVRWGGEEFLVVLPGLNPKQTHEVGQRILRTIRDLRLPGFPPLTVSGGMAMLNQAANVKALVALADERMYLAKEAGRDQLV
ncbi:sensor domain-containing diguanylate cyclase [Deinococcus hohokamensis]|uniref:Diguanylate cyclase domain-containing protein n=1 Tax=Deinococcus hohokamensis TaxID=309883 RepID=A0ABV9I9J4_9DEIO